MNQDFKKRHDQVFETLRIISEAASKQGKLVVFIGGSAVQAQLPKPLRLSFDLDICGPDDSEKIISMLETEYEVKDNGTSAIFHYYKAIKDKVETKIDVTSIVPPKEAYSQVKLPNDKAFTANIASLEYLLASKLTALSIGTIGRDANKAGHAIQFLKDTFDAGTLIDLGFATPTMWDYFEKVCDDENKLRGTHYPPKEVADKAVKALIAANPFHSQTTTTKSVLTTFQEYLIEGRSKQLSFVPHFCKTAAYLAAYERDHANPENGLPSSAELANLTKDALMEMEGKILSASIDEQLARRLRIEAPESLAYIHSLFFPRKKGGAPITTDTPGVYNPRFG
jgi:hypothetical protein